AAGGLRFFDDALKRRTARHDYLMTRDDGAIECRGKVIARLGVLGVECLREAHLDARSRGNDDFTCLGDGPSGCDSLPRGECGWLRGLRDAMHGWRIGDFGGNYWRRPRRRLGCGNVYGSRLCGSWLRVHGRGVATTARQHDNCDGYNQPGEHCYLHREDCR